MPLTERERKIRKIMKPVLEVGSGCGKCELCSEETSWTVNKCWVCPRCTVELGFAKQDRIPDQCEVCAKQGEWICGKDDQHSLCYCHRDAWFDWTREPFLPRGYDKLPEKEKDIAWEKAFVEFIQEMKNKQ